MNSGKLNISQQSNQPFLAASVVEETNSSKFFFEHINLSFIQKKLSVGAVDDPLEDEADVMADKVMRMPEKNFIHHQCNNCHNLIQKQDENETPVKQDNSWSIMQQQLANPNFLKLRTPFLERGVPH